jgi:acyl-CoA reductase-like NAD-dependent aldehyde dehydrogenase
MRSYDLYINGEEVEGTGWSYSVRASAFLRDAREAFNLKRGLELGSITELTDDVVGRCAVGDAGHVQSALESARNAFPAYSAFPLETRRRMCLDVYRATIELAPEMVEILVAEGHPRRLAEWEITGVVTGSDPTVLDWYAAQMNQFIPNDDSELHLVRKPDGVVCVNPPQNAAGSNGALGLLALLGGNTVVVKAPRSTPLSVMFYYREIVAPVLEKYGVPSGTLNLISGNTRQIIKQWIESPLVDDLLFFGDSATGLKIGADCVAAGKKAVLELSGNDGLVIWRDADLDAAAQALSECFFGSSQICMVPKYAVVHPEIADEFVERFLEIVRDIRPGFPEDPDVLLSPVLKTDRFFDFLSEAEGAGAETLCGGRRMDVHGEPSIEGLFLEPTVLRVDGLDRAHELSCVREETFFPMLPLVVPESGSDAELKESVIAFLNQNEYGLRNSLWTADDSFIRQFSQCVNNGGQLKINCSHIGFSSGISTHGGNGMTGGPYGELNYVGLRTTHLQGVCIGHGYVPPFDAGLFERATADSSSGA